MVLPPFRITVIQIRLLQIAEIIHQLFLNLQRVPTRLPRNRLRNLVKTVSLRPRQCLLACLQIPLVLLVALRRLLRALLRILPVLLRNPRPRELLPRERIRNQRELVAPRKIHHQTVQKLVLVNPVVAPLFASLTEFPLVLLHRLRCARMRVRIRITAHSSLFQHPPVIRIRMIQHITHLAPHVRHHVRPVRIRILFNRKTDIRIIPVIRSNIVRGRLDLSRLKGNVNHITVLVFFYKTVIAGNLAYFCQNFTAAKGTVKLRQYICVVFAAVIDCIYRAVQCFCPPCRAGIPAIIFGIVCHIITGWINRIQYFAQLCFCNGKFIRIQRLLDREINFKKFSIFILITFRKTPVIGKVESAPVSLSVPVGKFITELRKIRR